MLTFLSLFLLLRYISNQAVFRQLQKQVHEENLLQKSIIIIQQNSANFEEGKWFSPLDWYCRLWFTFYSCSPPSTTTCSAPLSTLSCVLVDSALCSLHSQASSAPSNRPIRPTPSGTPVPSPPSPPSTLTFRRPAPLARVDILRCVLLPPARLRDAPVRPNVHILPE
jgi:hypothetical protein